MTWQLASFTRPRARARARLRLVRALAPVREVLALVATLAALAALGRIAFAPLPNVKPTTDIVCSRGYALGGAPGLRRRRRRRAGVEHVLRPGAVDAVADGRLGARRRLGAVLGALTGAAAGRCTLAAACGAAGLGS